MVISVVKNSSRNTWNHIFREIQNVFLNGFVEISFCSNLFKQSLTIFSYLFLSYEKWNILFKKVGMSSEVLKVPYSFNKTNPNTFWVKGKVSPDILRKNSFLWQKHRSSMPSFMWAQEKVICVVKVSLYFLELYSYFQLMYSTGDVQIHCTKNEVFH